jgi:hypothetical protein
MGAEIDRLTTLQHTFPNYWIGVIDEHILNCCI